VTQLASTVVRIFTPEGTLVVQAEDPDVKVTVEGDGGLVVTGAGLEEIRLKPGSYRVQADRDGQPVPLERELVTVSRGGRETVRVKVEAPAAMPVAAGQRGAFVLLAAGKERTFDTLADAVQTASDGDTIEIRGNGPFISDGVNIGHSIVIRAGEGYTPSIALSEASADARVPLIKASAGLTLEGLELQRIESRSRETTERYSSLVSVDGRGSLNVLNCRLIFKGIKHGGLLNILGNSPNFIVRNCELYRGSSGVSVGWWDPRRGVRGTIENCVCANGSLWGKQTTEVTDVALSISHCSLAETSIVWAIEDRRPDLPVDHGKQPPIRLGFTDSLAAVRGMLWFGQFDLERPFSVTEAEKLLPRLIDLHERGNTYQSGMQMLQITTEGKMQKGTRGQDLADWNRLWDQQGTGSVEGAIRFQGGDVATRGANDLELLTPDDFRLRPDSAGYRAGKDGKDLGADVDLVGPGAAYERWKMMPEYQEWLEATEQEQ
jgi:hypothetical protein